MLEVILLVLYCSGDGNIGMVAWLQCDWGEEREGVVVTK